MPRLSAVSVEAIGVSDWIDKDPGGNRGYELYCTSLGTSWAEE